MFTGAGRTIIEGANIHILVFTDCKDNQFQKKLSRTHIYEYSPPPPNYRSGGATAHVIDKDLVKEGLSPALD